LGYRLYDDLRSGQRLLAIVSKNPVSHITNQDRIQANIQAARAALLAQEARRTCIKKSSPFSQHHTQACLHAGVLVTYLHWLQVVVTTSRQVLTAATNSSSDDVDVVALAALFRTATQKVKLARATLNELLVAEEAADAAVEAMDGQQPSLRVLDVDGITTAEIQSAQFVAFPSSALLVKIRSNCDAADPDFDENVNSQLLQSMNKWLDEFDIDAAKVSSEKFVLVVVVVVVGFVIVIVKVIVLKSYIFFFPTKDETM
jgi:hypothetical protein